MATYYEPDQASETELKLFIENDGDLYQQRTVPVMKNLMTKMAQGRYRKSMAPKLWAYLVEAGAKKYASELSGPGQAWNQLFPKPLRDRVASQLAREFEHEVKTGAWDYMIPEWIPKKYQKEFTTGETAKMANPGGYSPSSRPFNTQRAYKVTLYGRSLGDVFFDRDMTAAEVKRSLVDHDGYDPAIKVTKPRTLRGRRLPNPKYQGHPSYNHWNVALWVGNDEGLYQMARDTRKSEFKRELVELMPKTPDGVRVTQKLAGYAWDSVNEV